MRHLIDGCLAGIGVQAQQHIAQGDGKPWDGDDIAHDGGKRRSHHMLHLHRVHDHQRLALGHAIALLNRHFDHGAAQRRTQRAGLCYRTLAGVCRGARIRQNTRCMQLRVRLAWARGQFEQVGVDETGRDAGVKKPRMTRQVAQKSEIVGKAFDTKFTQRAITALAGRIERRPAHDQFGEQ